MKGVIHTLEVVIAVAMIAVALAGLFRPLHATDMSAVLVQSGYAALQQLEATGELRQAAVAGDTDLIRAALRPLLTNFEIEICDPQCSGTARQGAVALDYFIAGDQSFQPADIRLYLW